MATPSKYQAVIDANRHRGKKALPAAKIRAWIERHLDYKPRKDGDELVICNPFTGDISFKFNINPERGVCHCWTGDEWAGPINPETGKRNCSFINFIKLYRKCSYVEALREVLGTGDDLTTYLRPENRLSQATPVRTVVVALPAGTRRLADHATDSQGRTIIAWLKRRGYSLTDIDRHDLHFLSLDCYWPYYEFDELVYWQSRGRCNKIFRFPDLVHYDKTGAIIGKTDGGKGDYLYGFDDCENASYLILTESIFGQHTLGAQTLASGGASLTTKQLNKIRIIGPRKGIILSPDNDKAGLSSILANHRLLKPLGYPLFYSTPPKLPYQKNDQTLHTKDWNELVEEVRMTQTEVRKLHDDRLRPLNTTTMQHIRQLIYT